MARNVYFSQGSPLEQRLFEDITIEAISIYGMDVYYIPRKIIQQDFILNEDVLSRFENAFKIEMYVESVDGFEGDGKFISKFGLEIRDQVRLVVARRRWNNLIGRYGYAENSVRPREGDLIYFPMVKGLFEIKFVDDKLPFYQLKDLPTFKLTCELYEYRHENIVTGISEVDELQSVGEHTWRAVCRFDDATQLFTPGEMLNFTLPTGIGGNTKFIELIEDGDGDSASYIVTFDAMEFDDNVVHTLVSGTTFIGSSSGASARVTRPIPLGEVEILSDTTNFDSQNNIFENEGMLFLSFDETNPFGDP